MDTGPGAHATPGWDLLASAADLLAEHAPVVLGAVAPDGTLVALAGALTHQLAFHAEDWLGRPLVDLVDDDALLDQVRAALAGTACSVRTVVNGRPWTVVCRPRRGPGGEVVGAEVMTWFADQVELRSSLTAAAFDVSKLEALVNRSTDFISVAEQDTGRLQFLNPAGRALVGLADDADLSQLHVGDFLPPDVAWLGPAIKAEVAVDGHWSGAGELRHLVTGERIPVSASVFLVEGAPGGDQTVLATVQRDVRLQVSSDTALAERALEQQLAGELARLALTLPLPELLQVTVDLVTRRFDDVTCALLRRTPDGRRLQTVAATDPGWVSAVMPLVPGSLPDQALTTDSSRSSDDVRADDRFPTTPKVQELGLRAMLASPVPGADSPWALIMPVARAPRAWSRHDVAFVESLAATLGAAVRRHDLETQLQHQALHDPLTGLPNRALVTDRIRHALRRATRTGSLLVVLLLDLDDFKTVNDSLGHSVGDGLLAELALHFEQAVGAGDTVARLGGDEFVVVCEDVDSEADATFVAEALLAVCATGVEVEGRRLALSASIGMAFSYGGDVGSSDLLSEADIAMYRAKRDRPGTYQVFDETMRGEVVGRLNLAGELRAALRADRLEVAYQPIVDLGTGLVVGMEALARWTDEQGVVIPPDVFVPLAEQTGLVCDLGLGVLRKAAREAVRWQQHGPVGLRVNASSHELRSASYVGQVLEILREVDLPPQRLGIEITESMLVERGSVTQDTLAGLHDAGVTLLIDDFGTGYSSLSYLQRFPVVDVLKIDRSFLSSGPRGTAVVTAVVALGRAFGLTVCAEGVETAEQHRTVSELGCDLAQGYLLSRPVPAGPALDLVRRWQPVLPAPHQPTQPRAASGA